MKENNNNKYALIGLGNPGKKYSGSRHNCGQEVVSQYVRKHQLKYKSWNNILLAPCNIFSKKIFCMQSKEFLNNSGESYFKLINKQKIQNDNIILVADDIDINVGQMSIQQSKNHGGNNGVKSLLSYLDQQPIIRIRIGIGRPTVNEKPSFDPGVISQWVLDRPSKSEKQIIDSVIEQAVLAIDTIIELGIKFTMNQFNGLNQ